ncbi:uncharacterized protein LOC113367304 [Ctenocephalides felis]|uniref:uncharacterized protein LOC113367304 n=1 Tax=Ctenocephalides felis TaxID=7515 RepID=UPI000E6E5679|nr:uncharacterized protein LOC113367304 [Ctenocephalides felis]
MPKAKKSATKAKLRKTQHDLLQSCRLCGIIGGNRVPIIQETMTIGDDTCIDESNEIQINKKIQDCLSIEVKYGDNLPPLICVICLNKLNDFYEFRIMCSETNIRLHKALGISIDKPQPVGMVVSTGTADNQLDCILGVAGPVFFQPSSSTNKEVNKKITPIKKESKIKYKAPEANDEDDDKPLIKRVKVKMKFLEA